MENELSYNDEINLLDYWRILVKRRWWVGLIVFGVFVVSVVVSLLLPKIYTATTTLFPPTEEGSSGLGLGMMMMVQFGYGEDTASLWVEILESPRVQDAIITKFNLKKEYKLDTIEEVRNGLQGAVAIRKSKKGNIISIAVEDKDPKQAARIANAFVDELDRINKDVVMTRGKRTRLFLDRRLKETKDDLDTSENLVRVFQEQYKAVKLDDQSRTIIDAIGTLKGQVMAKEVEIEMLLSYSASASPQVEIIRRQIQGLKEQLAMLQKGTFDRANMDQKDIFIPTERLPEILFQYTQLVREAKIQEAIYQLLTQQYEMARIEETKDSPTVTVLDIAKAPEKRTSPKRFRIVLISTLMSAFVAMLIAILVERLGVKSAG